MPNWIVIPEDNNLLNLDRVREVVLEPGDADNLHKVVAYDSDTFHAENLWVLLEDESIDVCRDFIKALATRLDAYIPPLPEPSDG